MSVPIFEREPLWSGDIDGGKTRRAGLALGLTDMHYFETAEFTIPTTWKDKSDLNFWVRHIELDSNRAGSRSEVLGSNVFSGEANRLSRRISSITREMIVSTNELKEYSWTPITGKDRITRRVETREPDADGRLQDVVTYPVVDVNRSAIDSRTLQLFATTTVVPFRQRRGSLGGIVTSLLSDPEFVIVTVISFYVTGFIIKGIFSFFGGGATQAAQTTAEATARAQETAQAAETARTTAEAAEKARTFAEAQAAAGAVDAASAAEAADKAARIAADAQKALDAAIAAGEAAGLTPETIELLRQGSNISSAIVRGGTSLGIPTGIGGSIAGAASAAVGPSAEGVRVILDASNAILTSQQAVTAATATAADLATKADRAKKALDAARVVQATRAAEATRLADIARAAVGTANEAAAALRAAQAAQALTDASGIVDRALAAFSAIDEDLRNALSLVRRLGAEALVLGQELAPVINAATSSLTAAAITGGINSLQGDEQGVIGRYLAESDFSGQGFPLREWISLERTGDSTFRFVGISTVPYDDTTWTVDVFALGSEGQVGYDAPEKGKERHLILNENLDWSRGVAVYRFPTEDGSGGQDFRTIVGSNKTLPVGWDNNLYLNYTCRQNVFQAPTVGSGEDALEATGMEDATESLTQFHGVPVVQLNRLRDSVQIKRNPDGTVALDEDGQVQTLSAHRINVSNTLTYGIFFRWINKRNRTFVLENYSTFEVNPAWRAWELERNEDGTLKLDEDGRLIRKMNEDGSLIPLLDNNGVQQLSTKKNPVEGNPVSSGGLLDVYGINNPVL